MVRGVINMLLFVNIDSEGNVIDALFGHNVIPDRSYDFFFFATEEIATNAFKYKVVLDGMKPELVKKEG
jgi:hypothetical protein